MHCDQSKCLLWKYRTNLAKPRGNFKNPEVFIVGDGPDKQDDKEGTFFVGPSGKRLDLIIKNINVPSDKIYFTNVLRCIPWVLDSNNNRTTDMYGRPVTKVRPPSDIEAGVCLNNLYDEICYFKPKVIITLGNSVLQHVLNYTAISRQRGKVYKREFVSEKYGKHTCDVIPTYHPKAVLYQDDANSFKFESFIKQDIQYAFIHSGLLKQEFNYRALHQVEEISAYIDYVILQYKAGKIKFAVIDLETSSLDPFDPDSYIISIGITHKKLEGYVIPVNYSNFNTEIYETVVMNKMKELCEIVPISNQNIKFDAKWLYAKWGIRIKNVYFDTMLAQSLLYADTQPCDLDSMAGMYCGRVAYKSEMGGALENFGKNTPGAYGFVDFETLVRYNASDVDVTYQITEILYEQLKKENLWHIWSYTVHPAIISILNTEIVGAKMDNEYLEVLKKEYDTEIKRLEKEIDAYVKDRIAMYPDILKDIYKHISNPILLSSSQQKGVLIYNIIGVPLPNTVLDQKTARKYMSGKGAPSTDKKVFTNYIKPYLHKNGDKMGLYIVNLLNKYTKLTKLQSTYINGFEVYVKERGQESINKELHRYRIKMDPWLVHSTYNLNGAATGRLSCSSPPLQTLPRESYIRRLWVSRWADIGGIILAMDQSQLELRIMGSEANDPGMIQAFKDGADIHTYNASRLFNVSIDLVTSEQRSAAKAASFGVIYGSGPEGMADTFGISIDQAQGVIDSMGNNYPLVQEYVKKCHKIAHKTGFTYTPTGRRRPLPNIKSNKKYLISRGERQASNCVDAKTEILTIDGWKTYKEITKGTIILTKNKNTGIFEWKPLKNVCIFPNFCGDLISFESKTFSSLTTNNHRWLVYNKCTKKDHIKTSDSLSVYGDDRIHRIGEYDGREFYSDDFVKLIGWVLTDGSIRANTSGKTGRVHLYQSYRANLSNCNEIKSLLIKNNWLRHIKDKNDGSCSYTFTLNFDISQIIFNLFPKRILTPSFVINLSKRQANLLINTMLKGDGTIDGKYKRRRLCCGIIEKANMFQMLCVIGGYATTVSVRDLSKYEPKSNKLSNIPKSKTCYIVNILKRDKAQIVKSQKKVFNNKKELVWCPQVENETWIARRNSKVYITMNSPIQGGASDIVLDSINRMQYEHFLKQDFKSVLFGTVHDSVEVDVWPTELFEIIKFMIYEGETRINNGLYDWLRVPVRFDAELGINWLDCCGLSDFDYYKRSFTLEGSFEVLKQTLQRLLMTYKFIPNIQMHKQGKDGVKSVYKCDLVL